MQPRELERGRLREPATDVKGLHRLTRRAFHQVIKRGHDYDAVGIGIALEADVTPVGAREELRFRVAMDAGGLLYQPHERLVLVRSPVDGPDLLLRQGILEEDVRGGQNAAYSLDRGGRECDLRSLPFDGQL